MEAIEKIPEEQRAGVIELTAPYLKDITDGDQRASILWSIIFIPPDSRSTFLDELPQFNPIPKKPGQILQQVFRADQELMSKSHDFLQNQLENLTDMNGARAIASFILEKQNQLMIGEEHPLAQVAIQVLTILEDSKDIKNPYNVYKKLKELLEVETPEVDLPSLSIAGRNTALNPEGFRKKLAEKPQVTFKELPEEVALEDLSTLFEALEERLNNLNEEGKQRVNNEILNMTEKSLESLKRNFVLDPFLRSRLSIAGSPDDPVPQTVLGFRMILKFIKDQEVELKKGDLLTLQEEVLLKMSASIQNCPTGKAEGIILAYNRLPIKYKTVAVDMETGPEIRGADFVDRIVQETLTCFLSESNALMQELTGEENIGQVAHQALYVKNLIARRVGLDHQLKFDRHTQVLYDKLIERDLSNVLINFYKHLKPEFLVKKLIETVNRELEKGTSGLTVNLYAITSKEAHLTMFDIDYVKVEGQDEEKEIQKLTEVGAVEILKALGYLSIVSA